MFYHVSSNLEKIIRRFQPRIPEREKRMEGEDDTIPRICLGKSLEDCLSAMPDGGYHMETREKPHLFRIYEFDERKINPKNILTAGDLYFSHLVLDAWVTGEHWVVNQSLIPERVYDIELLDFTILDAPFVTPQAFQEALQKKGDPVEILEQLEEQTTKSVARVTDLIYMIQQEIAV